MKDLNICLGRDRGDKSRLLRDSKQKFSPSENTERNALIPISCQDPGKQSLAAIDAETCLFLTSPSVTVTQRLFSVFAIQENYIDVTTAVLESVSKSPAVSAELVPALPV